MCQKIKICVFYLFLICAFLTGCTNVENVSSEKETDNIDVSQEYLKTEVMGKLSHGVAEYSMKSNQDTSYIEYNGDELCFEYSMLASGMEVQGVGFMVFIDGEPQQYRTDNEDEYKYMHVFHLKEEKETISTFFVIPSTGEKGDVLELCVASIYYPDYKPDMVTSMGFGIYHHMLENIYLLKYNETPSFSEIENVPINEGVKLEDVDVYSVDVTERDKDSSGVKVYIDNQDVTLGNNYTLGEQYLNIHLEIQEGQFEEYGCTFYLNHVPVQSESKETIHIQTESDKTTIIDANINISLLEEPVVFYAILTPCNAKEIESKLVDLKKTNSVLLLPPMDITENKNGKIFLGDFSGYTCYAGNNQLMCLGDKITVLDSESLDILCELESDKIGVSFYDFWDCEVYDTEEGYCIIGTLFLEQEARTQLTMITFNKNYENIEMINLEDWAGANREIMKYELWDNGNKLLYSTMEGLYLFDSVSGETSPLETGEVFVMDFAILKSLNRVLFTGNDEKSNRVLGNIDLINESKKAEILENDLWGTLWAYTDFALIEEADIYGKEKEGRVFCYSASNGILEFPLTDSEENGYIYPSRNGEYFATKTRVDGVGYLLRIYSSVNGGLAHEYPITYAEYGTEMRLADILIDEETGQLFLVMMNLQGKQEGTWIVTVGGWQ